MSTTRITRTTQRLGRSAPAAACALPLTLTFAATRDVSFAVRGGRIPAWTLPVANALRLTAIAQMQPSGKLGVRGALFGRSNIPRRLAAFDLHLQQRQLERTAH